MRGHASRLRSFWGCCWNKPVALPAQWQEGLRCAFLMASTRGRLLVLGGNPLHGSDALASRMGACLWDLSLGQHTGDGKPDGRRFWVGRGCFFLGGAGEGKRNSRARNAETMRRCFAGRCEFQTACFMLYIIYCAVEVSLQHAKGHREGGPRSSIALGRHGCCSTSTARRPSPRIENSEGVVAPRSVTDSTEQWV